MKNKIEILAPAGNQTMLSAAVQSGADAVYLGIAGMNMRAQTKSFTLKRLPEAVSLCHDNGVRVYLTVNTVVYDEELVRVREILDGAEDAGIDAVICWDMGVLNLIRSGAYRFETHLSTQASVSNYEALKFYASIGVSRFVLARELTLKQIRTLHEHIQRDGLDVRLEAFAHGAMCVSMSGRCFISQFLSGKSANRGECLQPCRRCYDVYELTDSEDGNSLMMEERVVMSPKDICTVRFIDKIVNAGISCLKIEGRGRSPEYVKTTVECYRQAVDACSRGELTDTLKDSLYEKLNTVYNRGFSDGFYFGRPLAEWTRKYGNLAAEKKVYAGYIGNYFMKAKAADVIVEAHSLKVGDEIYIIGETTGCVRETVESIYNADKLPADSALQGETVGLKLRSRVRKKDKVYVIKKSVPLV